MPNVSITNGAASQGAPGSPRSLRLRIINRSNGQVKVALTLPVSLVSVAQRLGARLLPPDASVEAVVAQAEQQGVAQLAWENAEHDERLELTLE
ncbi:MAG: hypothetical protein M3R24_01345 [Chloroflexota bacterium]|nr:hypothetical protein [Chloroflexota bacterium]